MHNENYEPWLKLGKNLSSPLSEWNKTSIDLGKRLAELNLQIINENILRVSTQFRRLSTMKKSEDLFNLQKDCINENISSTIETTQKLIHVAMENMEIIANLWGSTASKITEKAVEKAQKFHEKEKEKHR